LFTCYLLFSKFFPVIAIAEIIHILKRSGDSFIEHMVVVEKKHSDELFVEAHAEHH
jgi:molybdopterin-containing oxidoreductase family membrane subunit